MRRLLVVALGLLAGFHAFIAASILVDVYGMPAGFGEFCCAGAGLLIGSITARVAMLSKGEFEDPGVSFKVIVGMAALLFIMLMFVGSSFIVE